MGNTARYGWGYPEVTDPPNLSLYVKNLAQAVEVTVGALDDARAAAAQPIGTQVGYGEITATSATWSSATKVVTNLTTTFTGIVGAVYEVEADATWQCAANNNNDALGIGWRLGGAGTVVNTDPIVGPRQQRSHTQGTGLNAVHLYGRITAVAAGTHCVAVTGWKPTGDVGVSNLFASTASGTNISTNIIRVKRVA